MAVSFTADDQLDSHAAVNETCKGAFIVKFAAGD